MQVRAESFVRVARFLERTHGEEGLRAVIAACSEPVRARWAEPRRSRWLPLDELTELAEVADRELARGDGKLTEQLGEALAEAQTKGLFRVVAQLAAPAFVMKRAAATWRRLHDAGAMTLLDADDHACTLEVVGVPTPSAVHCAMLTGWARGVGRTFGVDAIVRHAQCRARGATRCLWDVEWSAPIGRELFVPSLAGAMEK